MSTMDDPLTPGIATAIRKVHERIRPIAFARAVLSGLTRRGLFQSHFGTGFASARMAVVLRNSPSFFELNEPVTRARGRHLHVSVGISLFQWVLVIMSGIRRSSFSLRWPCAVVVLSRTRTDKHDAVFPWLLRNPLYHLGTLLVPQRSPAVVLTVLARFENFTRCSP